MAKVKIKWEYLVLIFILLIGFGIRYYNLYENYTFDGNDAPFFATFSIRMAGLENPIQNFLELINFRWGAVTPLVLAINIFILNLFKIGITEKLITLPIVIIGTLTIGLVYLLGKQVKNKYVGLLSAGFLAILPLHAAQSRNVGGTWIISPFLLTLTVFLLMKYFYHGKYGFACSLFLSLYLISTSLFGGLILLIPFIAILSVCQKNKTQDKIQDSKKNKMQYKIEDRIIIGLKKILKIKNFILPVLFLIIPVVSYLIFLYFEFKGFGFIGHIFNRSGGGVGFYINALFNDFRMDSGIFMVVLFMFGALYGLMNLTKYFDGIGSNKDKNKKYKRYGKQSILLIWAAIFTLPFLLFVEPSVTVVSTYLNSAIIPLIILSCIFIYDIIIYLDNGEKTSYMFKVFKIGKYCFVLMIILVFVLTLFIMTEVVHNNSKEYPLLQGSTLPNTGAKTAGYFIRSNLGESSGDGGDGNDDYTHTAIFTDLRPATAHYYFKMPVISSTDMEDDELALYFDSISEQVDVVVFRQENYLLMIDFLDEFYEIAEIRSDDESVMRVYVKEGDGLDDKVVLNIEKYDELFDKKYGNIHDLNFGLEEQIKQNKKLDNLLQRLRNSVFGFLFN